MIRMSKKAERQGRQGRLGGQGRVVLLTMNHEQSTMNNE